MKRLVDMVASGLALVMLSPLFAGVSLLIWLEDRHGPFYLGPRVGRGGTEFKMVKFRSMRVGADKTGVDSTAADDPRVTRMGLHIRRWKLDEFSQLVNVFKGEMSLFGPRPQVARDVALYTEEESRLLDGLPGITDFSSIVFADEGAILEGSADPDLRYNQMIRPYKSRLGLHYLDVCSVWLDLRLILATLLNPLSRRRALHWVAVMLRDTGAPADLVEVARRTGPLLPAPPPGANEIVRSR